MTKTCLTLASILFLLPCFSQRIFYSKATIKSYRTSYSIIGKVKDNILVWTKDLKNSNNEVLVFDADMRLLKKVRQADFNNVSAFKFFINRDYFVVGTQQINKDYLVFKARLFDEMASFKSEVVLDSVKANLAKKFVFNLLQSPDKTTICFVKTEIDASKNILRVDCCFTDGNKITRKLFGLPFNPYGDIISNISIDEDQNIYLLKTRNELNRCVLQIYKSVHDGSTMVWTEKQVVGLTLLQPDMLVNNNTCLVYGVFSMATIKCSAEGLTDRSQLYLWRTHYNLNDAPGDSLYDVQKGITAVFNIPPQNRPGNFFYAFRDSSAVKTDVSPSRTTVSKDSYSQQGSESLMFDPRAVPAQYANGRDFYSNRLSGTPVMIPDIENNSPILSNSGSSNFLSRSYQTLSYAYPLPVSLNIFSADTANKVTVNHTIHKDDSNKSWVWGAKIVRRNSALHVITSTPVSKNKYLLQYILFRDNGEEIETPVTVWKARYNYLVNDSVEAEDGLIMPANHNETVIFVKMALKN